MINEHITSLSFQNDLYKQLKINYENFFVSKDNNVDIDAPLIKQIQRISFELSNICNYSKIHLKCPLNKVNDNDKRILSSSIVYKVINEMSLQDFSGVFAFHRYNEPLIDPRLFSFIKEINKKCPKSKVLITTNGFYLTQELANELSKLDIWVLAVSAYSKSEFERLKQLNLKVPFNVFYSKFDNRESIYDAKIINLKSPCYAPIRDLTINVNGDVVLCCLDWENRYTFGNLKDSTIELIVNQDDVRCLYNELIQSKRNLNICLRCFMER